MRRLLYIAITLLLLTACSHIDEDERFIYVKKADVARRVLIEDFTGQRCVNCPQASLEIERLRQAYGAENVIAVSIHSGPLGFKGTATQVGLATDEGDTYYAHWGVEYQPQGMVDRQKGVLAYTDWAARVHEDIGILSSVEMSVMCTYDEATREVTVTTSTMPTSGNVDGKLQLWVVEDSVQAVQLRYNDVAVPSSGQVTDRDYIHHHVYRQSVNGLWGDDYHGVEGVLQQQTNHFRAADHWDARQLWVVAFVYQPQGVVQVCEAPVLSPHTSRLTSHVIK